LLSSILFKIINLKNNILLGLKEFKLFSYNCSFSDKKLITMGYWLDISDPPTGLYTVEVDGYAPFCV
jgi:hypothetical protein